MGYKETSGLTKGAVVDERKKQIVDDLTKKYGDVTVGIHGQELPKFSAESTTKEWWKFTKGFSASPVVTSAIELKETNKYWARNDEFKLADVRELHPPADPFKTTYDKKFVKDEVASKIQTINHW